MTTDTPREKRLTVHRLLWSMAGALGGAILGRLLVPYILAPFEEAPTWAAPAVIVGSLTLFFVATFVLVMNRAGSTRP